jgi:hypothetical protein
VAANIPVPQGKFLLFTGHPAGKTASRKPQQPGITKYKRSLLSKTASCRPGGHLYPYWYKYLITYQLLK